MKLQPNIALGFGGSCEAAFRLYEKALNGTIAFMLTWGNSPAAGEVPPDWRAKVYHATLKLGDSVETFWAIRYAAFVDQFGVPWTINCETPE